MPGVVGLNAQAVLYGAGVFTIGDWVTAGGAGTLVDPGHIKVPFELGVAMDNFDIETERATGIIATSPIKSDFTFKVAFHQAEAEWMRIAFGQPAANKTGIAPNFTLLVGDRVSQFHQGKLVVTGTPGSVGTLGVGTYTFWRLQVIGVEPIQFGKGVEQMYVVTFRALRDDSVATADKHFKRVDTAGA